MTKDELIDRLRDIEWEDFEAKEAQGELPKSIWETVSAFSNTDGGWIVLGVRQTGQSFEIVGVANAEKLEQDFTGTLRSQKFNTRLMCECRQYIIDGKKVLLFHVPSSQVKPVYFNSPANTFIRMGSGDQHATENEIISMYHDQSFGVRSELPVPDSDFSMINPNTLDSYRRFLAAFNPTKAYQELNDRAFCEKFNIMNRKGELTYAGLLMLGKGDEVLRYVPTFCMDYIEIPAPTVELSPMRYSYRIPEQENLWETFLIVSRRLEGLVNRPYRVNRHGIGVEDLSEYEILREAWLNMLMHTDHFSPMRSCVHVFTDHIEFVNAGCLPLPLEEIEARLFSSSRNPTIAKLFRFTRLCENAGYGMGKLRSWKKVTGYDMSITTERTLTCTTFYGTNLFNVTSNNLNDESVNGKNDRVNKENDRVNKENDSVNKENDSVNKENDSVNKENDSVNNESESVNTENESVNNESESVNDSIKFKLSPLDVELLKAISLNNKIKYNALLQILNISLPTLHRHISKLKSYGLLTRIGSDKTGHWQVNTKMLED